jgi:uncharacterized protein YoxC
MNINGEAFVGVILQASLIAIGLLMAIFGIILPSIKTILEIRFEEFKKLINELEKDVKNLKQSPKNINNKISDTIFDIQKYKSPLPFRKYHVLIAILLYVSTVLTSTHWFFVVKDYQENYLIIIGVIFAISTAIFGYIAYQTINTIFKVIESISKDTYSQMQESETSLEYVWNALKDDIEKK